MSLQRLLSSCRQAATALVALLTLIAASATAIAKDEPLKAVGKAPPKHEVLNHARGGAYFVASDLKNQYDELLAIVSNLKTEVDSGKVQGVEAVRRLRDLQPQLEELRKEIDERKMLVQPANIQRQSQKLTFEPGEARMLVITADNISVVGWDKPEVECVLEKEVLSVDEAPQTADFDELTLTHRRGQAAEMVGWTDAEYRQQLKEFENEKRDEPLPPERLARRREFYAERKEHYAPFASFQGKEIDILDIKGLTHDEGNRWFSTEVTSPDGGGAYGGDWKRAAKLTVYVPKSNGVLLRGCLAGLDVRNLVSPLFLTTSGSLDRNYNGRFEIDGLTGPLTLFDAPLDRLSNVTGDVRIVSTTDLINSGSRHADGKRVLFTYPARTWSISKITGNLTAQFSQSNLELAEISGTIDVHNEHGDTKLTIALPMAEAAHRVVSQCGDVEVEVKADALGKLPLSAWTAHGSVITNASQQQLEDHNVGLDDGRGNRRNWRGLQTLAKDPTAPFIQSTRSASAALEGTERSAGLDLVSESGDVTVTVK